MPTNIGTEASCSADVAVQELAAWLSAGGAWLSPQLELSCRSNIGGRGIMAVGFVAPGEVIARVPYRMLLSNDAALSDDVGLQAAAESVGLTGTNLAAVALLRQRHDGRAWQPFARALPSTMSATLNWTAAELAELQASDLAPLTAKRVSAIHAHHAALAALPHEDVPSLDELAWALSMVWARGHTIPMAAPNGQQRTQACLAPLLDLFNADFRTPSVHAAEASGDELTMRAARPMHSGDEATAPYGAGGPLSNARALFDYGFCVPDNLHDDVALPLDLSNCTAGAAALAALQLLPPSPSPRLRRLPSKLPAEANAFARVCTMAAAEADAVRQAARTRGDFQVHTRLGAPLRARDGDDADRAAAAFLASHMRWRLASYATSPAADEELLRGRHAEADVRRVCAVRVRLAEKQILVAHAAALDAAAAPAAAEEATAAEVAAQLESMPLPFESGWDAHTTHAACLLFLRLVLSAAEQHSKLSGSTAIMRLLSTRWPRVERQRTADEESIANACEPAPAHMPPDLRDKFDRYAAARAEPLARVAPAARPILISKHIEQVAHWAGGFDDARTHALLERLKVCCDSHASPSQPPSAGPTGLAPPSRTKSEL